MRPSTDARTSVTTICARGVLLAHKDTSWAKQMQHLPTTTTRAVCRSTVPTAAKELCLRKGIGVAIAHATMMFATSVSVANELFTSQKNQMD